jgi:DnaJ-class molecular chaperone
VPVDYRDYYKVLGVGRDATQAEVKRAFRKLARENHPDLKPGDGAAERRFKEVNEANEVLSDPDKRKRYDQLGANWAAYSGSTGAGDSDPFGAGGPFAGYAPADGSNVRYEFRSGGDAGGFSDFFRTFFSGAAAGAQTTGRDRPRRGSTTADQGSSFEDILSGMGLGGSPGAAYGPAPRRSAGAAGGSTRPPSVEAEVELSLEEAYHGTSRLVQVDGKRLEVTVPRGVETGSRIRLKGRGGGDPAHPADLYLVARVQHHPVYTRLGADLSREVPISLGEALLGAEIPVTTLKGRIRLTIPAETQTGRIFRLKGQGMPRLKPKSGEKETGDLLIKVKVVLPTGLSVEAVDAARRLAELAAQPDPRGETAKTT